MRQMTSAREGACFSPTRSNWLPFAHSVQACARPGRHAIPHCQTTTRSLGVFPPHVPVVCPPSNDPARRPKSVRPRGLGRAPPTGPPQALSVAVPFRPASLARRPWQRGARARSAGPVTEHRGGTFLKTVRGRTAPPRSGCAEPPFVRASEPGAGATPRTLWRGNVGEGARRVPPCKVPRLGLTTGTSGSPAAAAVVVGAVAPSAHARARPGQSRWPALPAPPGRIVPAGARDGQ